MAFKPKQKEFKSIAGNKYTFQTIPNSIYLKLMDNSTNAEGKPLLTKLYPDVLEHIVASPQGLTVDDFDNFAELGDVCENALNFQLGQ
ncbi:hypothetical protein EVU96_24865 [Bacillus infantis]|uniref:hypothetical protein n=1 Tax=Bacillus infantis TaxID=324767 RepID=UPI00101D59B8|nr:hypothetical protein [Bacillus infantis]RYI25200.1 hypothetical protein EVU96_24865 [Bacillus infantis]